MQPLTSGIGVQTRPPLPSADFYYVRIGRGRKRRWDAMLREDTPARNLLSREDDIPHPDGGHLVCWLSHSLGHYHQFGHRA